MNPRVRLAGWLERLAATATDLDKVRAIIFDILLVVSALASLSVGFGNQNPFYPPSSLWLLKVCVAVWVFIHLPLWLLARRGHAVAAYTIFVYGAFVVLTGLFQTTTVDRFLQLNMQLGQVYSLFFVAIFLLSFRRFLLFCSIICTAIVLWILAWHDTFLPPHGYGAAAGILANVAGMWALAVAGSGLLSVLHRRLAAAITEYAGLNARLHGEVAAQAAVITRDQERLHQAQKLEAIGVLAGGIAHDFNNKLTVITGYCTLLLEQLADNPVARARLALIRSSADESATLTRQLLSFGRRQLTRPRVVNLNAAVSTHAEMLSRLLGEHTEFRTVLASDLRACMIDPGQLEQVLMNLIVNARDAMPQGGRLEIRTANTEVADGDPNRPPDAAPGAYVTLSIRDSGHGMDVKTLARIFEPFFTTKGPGKGTGLGLAAVHGIVKQGGGYIEVDSEPGVGTVFRVHLPALDVQAPTVDHSPVHDLHFVAGHAAILVVEDEPRLRELIVESLASAGYAVTAAADPEEAVRVAGGGASPVDLLITDVIMPGGGGKAAADEIARLHPDARVLYISGYAEDVIVHQGVLDERKHFLQKPFSPHELLQKVQEVLPAGD